MDKDAAPVGGLAIAADATQAVADLLPFDMLAAVAILVDPAAVARSGPERQARATLGMASIRRSARPPARTSTCNPWRPAWAQSHTRH
jgi:hypothetical protein